MRRPDDSGVATVVGALLVLGILGMAIVYVNAFHVPRQGLAFEIDAREDAEAALAHLAGSASAGQEASVLLPLVPERPIPPLLSGIVLSPVRQEGRLAFEPEAARITISHVTAAPAAGVPPGDPTREALPGGLMRVYDLGSASQGAPLGSLAASVGGAYVEPADYRLEGGALLLQREDGSALVIPPALDVSAGGSAAAPTTRVAWRIPILTGPEQDVSGSRRAHVALLPGPLAQAGGGEAVHSVTIRVETGAVAAWQAALEQLVGARGTVTTSAVDDAGSVTATIGAPPGAPAGVPSVELRLSAAWHQVSFAGRAS